MEYVEPIRDLKMIEAMKKHLLKDPEHGTRNHLLFVLGINSALRVSDLLRLTVGDVMEEITKVKEKKTGKFKQFPLNKSATRAIKMHLKTLKHIDPSEPLFRSRKTGRAISRVMAWYILSDAAAAVGIKENIGTHTLRKTFGYHAYNTGVAVELLQKILNHSTPSITLRYIGITQDDVDKVYRSLNL